MRNDFFQELTKVHRHFCFCENKKTTHNSQRARNNWYVDQRHAGMPHRQLIRRHTSRGTVFERLDKLRHHFCVFFKFRHQTDLAGQVRAHVVYLTQRKICNKQNALALALKRNTIPELVIFCWWKTMNIYNFAKHTHHNTLYLSFLTQNSRNVQWYYCFKSIGILTNFC